MLKFVKYMIVVALLFTTSFLGQDVALAGGGFSASCQQIALNSSSDGLDLDATCRANNQSLVNNHLPLNPHIANDNANLVWRKDGGFSASVADCNLHGQTNNQLTCLAQDRGGLAWPSSINLDDEIANYNGKLTVIDGF